jgi:hypothetical protein
LAKLEKPKLALPKTPKSPKSPKTVKVAKSTLAKKTKVEKPKPEPKPFVDKITLEEFFDETE